MKKAVIVGAVLALTCSTVVMRAPDDARAAAVFTVDSIADGVNDGCDPTVAGDCNLRGAISQANATPGIDTIEFDIPSGDCPDGVCSLAIDQGKLLITESVVIDGTTQPQNGAPNAGVCATESTPLSVRVVVVQESYEGVATNASDTEIRGMGFAATPGTKFAGISVEGGSGHVFTCNDFAVDGGGVFVYNISSDAAGRIGTDGDGVDDIGEMNVFGRAGKPVNVNSGGPWVIAGNTFGLAPDGETSLGAGIDVGVYIRQSAHDVLVGSDLDAVNDDVEANVFGHLTTAIQIDGSLASGVVNNTLAGNLIGVTRSGSAAPVGIGIDFLDIAPNDSSNAAVGNVIGNASTAGIVATGTAAGSSAEIRDNLIGGDVPDGPDFGNLVGVLLEGAGSHVIAGNELAANNTGLRLTGVGGVELAAGSTGNCLVGNTTRGVTNETMISVTFVDNWWGDASGPSDAGPGVGDAVSVDVDFEPFLTEPPAHCVTPPNNPPVIADQSFSVAEEVEIGSTVGVIVASDVDGDPLTFSALGDATSNGFAVDPTSGAITVAVDLALFPNDLAVLTVEVSDGIDSDVATIGIAIARVAELPPDFLDVPTSNVFYSDIMWMREQGITVGCNPPANDRYCPDVTVTRGQMASFMRRALEGVLVEGTATDFVDDDSSVHEADIEWLSSVGVTAGCNPPVNDRFCPDDTVTRAQMASFMRRALEGSLAEGPVTDFVDDDSSVHEADIEWLSSVGVTAGCNPPVNDRYCPESGVTRGQMTAFMRRALG